MNMACNKVYYATIGVVMISMVGAEVPSIEADIDGKNLSLNAEDVIFNLASTKTSLLSTLNDIKSQAANIADLGTQFNAQALLIATATDTGNSANGKISDVNTTLNGKISGVSGKLGSVNSTLSGNIDSINSLITGLTQKNEALTQRIEALESVTDAPTMAPIVPSRCSSYANTTNTTAVGLGRLPGDVRVVQCKDGFSVNGQYEGDTSTTVICGANLKWSDDGATTMCSNIKVETVTCCLTFDNYVRGVFVDGKAVSVSGDLESWPTVKRFTFKDNAKVLGVHGQDGESGCKSGFFSMTCSQPSRMGRWNVRTDTSDIDRFEVHTEKQNPTPDWDNGNPRLWATVNNKVDGFEPSLTASNADTATWAQNFVNRVITDPQWASCGAHSSLGSFCAGNTDQGPTDWWFRVFPSR